MSAPLVPLGPLLAFLAVATAAICFSYGWSLGRTILLRSLPLAVPPPPQFLGDAADMELLSELMVRWWRVALRQGDEEQLASIYDLAGKHPSLLQRLAAESAGQPVAAVSRGRAQA